MNNITVLMMEKNTSQQVSKSASRINILYIDLLKKVLTDSIYIDRIVDKKKYIIPPPSKFTFSKYYKYILRKRQVKKLKKKGLELFHIETEHDLKKRFFERENGQDWPKYADTMVGLKRLNNVQDCIEKVIQNNVKGDFIETGVWRGGVTILMRALLKVHDIRDRKVWVADSFEGLPKPDPKKFPADQGDTHNTYEVLKVSLDDVKQNFKKYGLLDEQVIFLKGWFEDTLPKAPIEKLSILRLDGDMYSSTITALNALYEKVSSGGYIIVDDYFLEPCRKAIHDFRDKMNITDQIIQIDSWSTYWQKT